MKLVLKSTVVSLIFLFFLFGFTFYYSLSKGFEKETVIEVRKGDTIRSVLRRLSRSGDFNNLDLNLALLYARLTGLDRVKRGRYLVSGGETLLDFLKKINSGKGILVKITIPEGYNVYQIAETLDRNGVCGYKEFLDYALSKGVAARYNIPGDRVEGFLFPDTYKFSADTPPMKIIDTMIKNFWKHYSDEFMKRTKEMGWSVYKVVTLASIIQKETSVVDEMPIISAVYHNRLKKGMLLQADPTVIYGLMPHFDGNLRKRDLLDRNNPWNTYVHKGLPPTPICNPGVDAIRTALWPANVNYLYFVARGDGRHFFSVTYKEHLKAVRKYQLGK